MPTLQIHALRDVDLFHSLNEKELDWISQRLYVKTFSAGADIMTAEQPGETVYLILNGTVKIHVEQFDGRDVVLAILGRGDILGEMSLIDSAGRSASAVTLDESLLAWMSGNTFQECLHTMPAFGQNLVRILAGRLRLANELIQALASLDVYGRVARQILAFAEKYGQPQPDGDVRISIRLTQGDMADLVGASRKRVNQVMVDFKGRGAVSAGQDGYITLHDRALLASYCR